MTRWTKLDTHWEGVAIQTILELAQVRPTANHVVGHAEQGYTANVPLEVLDDDDVLLADTFDGEPLEADHGYPLRLIVPKRYFWKGPKWIRGLEFLTDDRPASGSATATTTTPTRGRNSASRSRRARGAHRPGALAQRSLRGFSARLHAGRAGHRISGPFAADVHAGRANARFDRCMHAGRAAASGRDRRAAPEQPGSASRRPPATAGGCPTGP